MSLQNFVTAFWGVSFLSLKVFFKYCNEIDLESYTCREFFHLHNCIMGYKKIQKLFDKNRFFLSQDQLFIDACIFII